MANNAFWVFYDSFAKIQSNFMSTDDAQTSILKMRPQDVERFLIWTEGWQNWQPLKTYLESDQKNFVSTFTVPAAAPKTELETVKAAIKDIIEKTQTSFKHRKEKNEDTNTKSYSNIHLEEETISRIVKEEQEQQLQAQIKEKSFDGDEITWSNIQKPNLDFSKISKKPMSKREIRHELKIEVLLISSKGKTFRSRSKNISLSGSLLEDTIPFDYYGATFDAIIINNQTKDPLKARVKLTANTVGDSGLSQRIHYTNVTDQQKKALQLLLEDYMELQKAAKAS